MSLKNLINEGPKVINIGMERFFEDLKEQEAEAVHVAWRPPLGSKELLQKLRMIGRKSDELD